MDNTPTTQPTAADLAKQLEHAADNAPSFGGLKPAAQAVAGFAAAVTQEMETMARQIAAVDEVNMAIVDKLPLLLAKIDALEKAVADDKA